MRSKSKLNIQEHYFLVLGLFCLGIMLRYFVLTLGHNFDFDSYCIVGEIAGNFRNVYAETERYNYAPIFLCIQGLLFRVAQVNPSQWQLVYRVLIVSVLTATDLGIAVYISKKYSVGKALLFFLNPVSIIITGYHNQFDNIAVLFALLSITYFNTEDKITLRDWKYVALFSLSLMTKHILFLLPAFILLIPNLPIKKKAFYAFVPPAFFLLSFLPFALASNEAFHGIIDHVFRYRSFNNAPLLSILYNIVNFPSKQKFIVYGLLMLIVAWFVRRLPFDHIILIYLIAMVSCSSAIANQYLVIPMAALCILNVWKWDKVYSLAMGLYLLLESDGLHLLSTIQTLYTGSFFEKICSTYVRYGYTVGAWILFFALIHLIRIHRMGMRLTKNTETAKGGSECAG